MLNLVCLPATEPGDTTYGTIPAALAGRTDVTVYPVRFPTLVWYNRAVREQAAAQIRRMNVGPIVLVGFSKSGLGAWHLAQAMPDRVAATIIFDAPVARAELPPWQTAPFYANDAEWQADSPIRHIAQFQARVAPGHRLVLIAGNNFLAEMASLSAALRQAGVDHHFRPEPDRLHHWNSGWLEEAVELVQGVSDKGALAEPRQEPGNRVQGSGGDRTLNPEP